jgi:two-component system, cell cycle sensor histidine kinase and response regulator CckA
LQNIRATADRLSEFTDQILSYSGRSKVTHGILDLSRIVEDMVQLLKVSLPKQIDLRLELMPCPPAMEGNISQIRQVVMNLITNAAEAMEGQAGVISIRTGTLQIDQAYLRTHKIEEQLQEGPYVFLEITDTGCGLTPEIEEKIFDPFFTTKSSGRGLGLAAVQGIIRSHKGVIKIYSEKGRGTTFTILFPCA